jgi:hypothetical protein
VHHLWAWILELSGSKDSASEAYNFWSGFGGDVTILASILAAPIVLWRKHNCGIRRCPRLARHEFKDVETGIVHQLCRKHHPEHPGKKPVTEAHIRDQYHLYLGKQRGKG